MSRLKNALSWVFYYMGFGRGPKPGTSEVINRSLQGRPSLPMGEWFLRYWEPMGVRKEIADFVYKYLPGYSGIDFSRVIPSDRLIEDLHFNEVCWSDWDMDLRDDFQHEFQVDILKMQGRENIYTVQQLVHFLNRVLAEKSMSPS